MTPKEIREEMLIRLDVVRMSAELAIRALKREDFSQMDYYLDQIKMYSERARLDHAAAYAASR